MIPRSRSSGALSMSSNGTNSASPFTAWIPVIAAVNVVFPWSTCPIVPTFTCGFVRSNFALAIASLASLRISDVLRRPGITRVHSAPGPASIRAHDRFCHALRNLVVAAELHRVDRASLTH